MSLKVNSFAVCDRISFLCVYSIVCIYNILFILSSIDDHLGHFYLRALVNNDEMDMGMQRFVSDFIFISFWYIFRSELLDHMIDGSIFKFLRRLHTVLHGS